MSKKFLSRILSLALAILMAFSMIQPLTAHADEVDKSQTEVKQTVEQKPEEKKPEEQKPEEQKPEEQKPEEQKPEEQKPEEEKPEEQKPEEQKPEEEKPEEQKPEEQKPEEQKPEEEQPEEEEPKYVRNVHAKDGFYPTNGHELGEEVRIGTGKVDFPAFFKKLHSLGYDGAVTIEREIEGAQQDADILAARDYLKQIFAAL